MVFSGSHSLLECRPLGTSLRALSAISFLLDLHAHSVTPLLNFLPSKHCKYSPWISMGDSQGVIFLGINCFHLPQGINGFHLLNEQEKQIIGLVYFITNGFSTEKSKMVRTQYVPPTLCYPRVVIIYLHVYFSLQTLGKLKRLFLCIPRLKQCLVLHKSLKTDNEWACGSTGICIVSLLFVKMISL